MGFLIFDSQIKIVFDDKICMKYLHIIHLYYVWEGYGREGDGVLMEICVTAFTYFASIMQYAQCANGALMQYAICSTISSLILLIN